VGLLKKSVISDSIVKQMATEFQSSGFNMEVKS
jgi:hypothetical protein